MKYSFVPYCDNHQACFIANHDIASWQIGESHLSNMMVPITWASLFKAWLSESWVSVIFMF